MRRYRLAVLGGTFDHLHAGHAALLATAFRVGRSVAIGVTTDAFLGTHPKPRSSRIQSYSVRRDRLLRWLRARYPRHRWRVSPLENPYGRSVDPEVKALVVSADTERGGRAVNRERRRRHVPTVPLVVVPLVLADDLEPVSSRRIRAGQIDPEGHRRSPIRVALDVEPPEDRGPATRAIRSAFPTAVVLGAGHRDRRTPGRRAPELEVRVRRGARGTGWVVGERSARLRLRPRRVKGTRAVDLETGLAVLLRPRP